MRVFHAITGLKLKAPHLLLEIEAEETTTAAFNQQLFSLLNPITQLPGRLTGPDREGVCDKRTGNIMLRFLNLGSSGRGWGGLGTTPPALLIIKLYRACKYHIAFP